MLISPSEQIFQTALADIASAQFAHAERSLRKILSVEPDHDRALHQLGLLGLRVNRAHDALPFFQRACSISPNNPIYQNNLGTVFMKLARLNEAIACWQRAVAIAPDYSDALANLGVALAEMGKFAEAIACYQRAVTLKPDAYQALRNLGLALEEVGHLDEAIESYRQAIAIWPGYANAHRSLGLALEKAGRSEEAVGCLRDALSIRPDDPDLHNTLAAILQRQGKLDEAAERYRAVLAMAPNHAEAHFNLGLLLLSRGDFLVGFREYEWRWGCRTHCDSARSFVQPRWDGSDLRGKTILLHAEQGLGDAIQMIRFAKSIAHRNGGGRVVVECHLELKRLFAGSKDIVQCVAKGEALPHFDVHCPMMSLPLALNTTLDSIPKSVPYIEANPADVERWRKIVEQHPGRVRVGLVWSSSSTIPARSLPSLAALAPLGNVPEVCFYSLQKSPSAIEAAKPPAGMRMVDCAPGLHDLAETAAVISNMDFVISVDTAVAHLAGAMGKPVWTLLMAVPDWRWLIGREDSPWYPTMRLFRQRVAGEWGNVIDRAAMALRNTINFI